MAQGFTKYHGTGNDFIIIDDRASDFDLGREAIAALCERRFGIGADGLILLQKSEETDFRMLYFNSDGRESSMCGNGGRCIVHFAHRLGVIGNECRFVAIDGLHEAIIRDGIVELKMNDVKHVERHGEACVMDTGSPHYVEFRPSVAVMDLLHEAHRIRQSESYREAGINVNFCEWMEGDAIRMRTYERGVEAETWSCGTGAVAVAVSAAIQRNVEKGSCFYDVNTPGGRLQVRLEVQSMADGSRHFKDIWLCGPAVDVFSGELPGSPA